MMAAEEMALSRASTVGTCCSWAARNKRATVVRAASTLKTSSSEEGGHTSHSSI